MNGKPIRNLKELVAEVDSTADAYLRLDLEYDQARPHHHYLIHPCHLCSRQVQNALCSVRVDVHELPALRAPKHGAGRRLLKREA